MKYTNKNTEAEREYHKGALVGEKATPEQIAVWQSVGILPKAVTDAGIAERGYNVYVSVAPLGKVHSTPIRFSSLKRARAYADECQRKLSQNTIVTRA